MPESNLAIAVATYAPHVIVHAVHFGYFAQGRGKCDTLTPVVMTDLCGSSASIPQTGFEKSTEVCLGSLWRKGFGWYSKAEWVLAIQQRLVIVVRIWQLHDNFTNFLVHAGGPDEVVVGGSVKNNDESGVHDTRSLPAFSGT